MLKHSVSSLELGYRSHVEDRGLEGREFRRKLHSVCTDNGLEDSIKAGSSFPPSSIGSSYSAEINRNFSGECSLVSSEVDRWLSSEILAPLASREDSRLTNEIKRSKSFCYGELRIFSESESRSVKCDLVARKDKTNKDCDFVLGYSSAHTRKDSDISRSDDHVYEPYGKEKEKYSALASDKNSKHIGEDQKDVHFCPSEGSDFEHDIVIKHILVSDQNDYKDTSVNLSLSDESNIKHSDSETEDDFIGVFDVEDEGNDARDQTDVSSVSNLTDSDDPIDQNVDIVQTGENSLKNLTNSNNPSQPIEQSVNVVHSSNLYPEGCDVKCVTVQVSINSEEEEIYATPNQQKFEQLNTGQSSELFVLSNSNVSQDFANKGDLYLPVAVDTQVREKQGVLWGSNTNLETDDQHGHYGLYQKDISSPQNSLQNPDRDKRQNLIEEITITVDGRKSDKSNDDNSDNIACSEEKCEELVLEPKIRSSAKGIVSEVEGNAHTRLLTSCKANSVYDEVLKEEDNYSTTDLQNSGECPFEAIPDFDKEDYQDLTVHPCPGINTEVEENLVQPIVVQTGIDQTEVIQEDKTALFLPVDPSRENTSLPESSLCFSINSYVEIQEKEHHCNHSEIREYSRNQCEIDSNILKEIKEEPACSLEFQSQDNREDLHLTNQSEVVRTEIAESSTTTFDHLCEVNIQDSEFKEEKEDNISDSVAPSKELTDEQLISSHCVLHTLDQSSELKEKPFRHSDNINVNQLEENYESSQQNVGNPCALKTQEFNKELLISEANSKSFQIEGSDANSIVLIACSEGTSLTEVKESGTDVPNEHIISETALEDKAGYEEKLVTNTSLIKHQEGFWKEKDSKFFKSEDDVYETQCNAVKGDSLQIQCNEPSKQKEELGKDFDIGLPVQSSYFKCQQEGTANSSQEESVPSEVSVQEKKHLNTYTSLNYETCMTENHLLLEETLSEEKTERDKNTTESKHQTEETVCQKKDSSCLEDKQDEDSYETVDALSEKNIIGGHLNEQIYSCSTEENGKVNLPPSTESELDVGNPYQVKMDKQNPTSESLNSEKEACWNQKADKSSLIVTSNKRALIDTEDSTIRLKMEKEKREFTPDNQKPRKDKGSKKKRRMNSDSALLYEKSRYSLGILLEEIHDLVRKTQSFECSDLDIRYNPVKDLEGGRVDPEKQITAAKRDDRENNLTTDPLTNQSNLLGFVELYTGGGKQRTDFSGSSKKATSENIIATMESKDIEPIQMKNDSTMNTEGEENEKGKMDFKLCKTDFSELSREPEQQCKERIKSITKAKTLYEERPVGEDDTRIGDLKLVTDLTPQQGTETNPPESRREFSGIEVSQISSQKDKNAEYGSPQNSSVSSKKEQKRKFPLRMLRRKSVVTSVSLLDADGMDDPSVGIRNISDTDYSRQKGTVDVPRNISTNEIERFGMENRSFSKDALGQFRSGDSFENMGRGRENANVFGWKKSHLRNLSSSSSFSEKNYVTSSDQKKLTQEEATGHRSSSTGVSTSDRARQLRDSYSHSEKTVLSKGAASHLSPPSIRDTRGDRHISSKPLCKEKTSDNRLDISTLTSRVENKDKLSKRSSLDGTSAYGKHPSTYNMYRMGALSKSQTISTEGLSAFDKVVSKGKKTSGNSSLSRGKDVTDGPLSLHESTIMMNADTGQSPQKSGSQSMEDPSQNPTEQMNGQINYDEICNIKNLKDEEMLQRVPELVQALRGLDEYDRAETMKILKSIGDTYWNFRAIRNKIGNALAEEGFAEITMKILKTLNGKGIFKNDSIWFPVYYCFNTLWNYSDASLKLAKSIADNDGVRFFTINCDHEPYIKNLHSKNVYYVVKASMSILHNISRTTDIHHYFKENGTTEVMLKFATWKDLTYEMLKVMSLLTLAHIVEEEDNDKLIDETGAIESCIKYITKALKNTKRRHLGFTPQEVMDGLSKLAVNDKNKKKIIEAGALPVFLEMLKGEHTEEQAITARAIWNLSFDKEVCQQIVEYPEMIERLESLTNSQDKIVAKNVSGALFVLKGENDVSKRPKSAKKNKGHVFISYSWNEKEIVMKIRERLKKEGVEVWIDVERMGGSTLSAMAEAVENAALVLICMSEKYKESPNCRLEAEYTFQLRKEYIPLMVQKRYRPDGWLGMILGAKLYFDFSGKYPFEKPWNGLMKELKSIGRLSVLENPSTDKTDAPVSSSSSLQGSQPIRQSSTASKVYQMNTEDVSNWLCSLKLDGCVPSFAQFDGKLLAQLKSMKSEAAEFYYHCLEKNMNMNLVEILTFTEGLEKL